METKQIECPACGFDHDEDDEFVECNFCGVEKCAICNMGSAVPCIACEGEEEF